MVEEVIKVINNTVHRRPRKRLPFDELSRFDLSHEYPIHYDISPYEVIDDKDRKGNLDGEVERLGKETKK